MKEFIRNWWPIAAGFVLSVMVIALVIMTAPGCVVGPQKETNLTEIRQESCELQMLHDEGYNGLDFIRQRELREKAYRTCQAAKQPESSAY